MSKAFQAADSDVGHTPGIDADDVDKWFVTTDVGTVDGPFDSERAAWRHARICDGVARPSDHIVFTEADVEHLRETADELRDMPEDEEDGTGLPSEVVMTSQGYVEVTTDDGETYYAVAHGETVWSEDE